MGENSKENSLAKCQAKMLTLFGLRYKTHGLQKRPGIVGRRS